ncbi:hypothetical protein [Bacillus sp. MRMR6]|uniref:hypothetical protein n=1 Tax=Bacillus sp. MRMR6 TaxID=1928617 RepID=UPI000952FA90|nr:hypothetical protein [Bacillus sp. MRMR6]OLS38598.1 hypothetical protein BTR25_14370 [Bacillus sp. MRMR6]
MANITKKASKVFAKEMVKYADSNPRAGCLITIGLFTLPLWLILFVEILELFLAYVVWGQKTFGFRDKSFLLYIYSFLPIVGTPCLLLGVIHLIQKFLISKEEERNG